MSTVATLMVKLQSDIRDFQKGMDTASSKVKDVGKKMSAVGATLSKTVTLPILAAGAAFSKSAMDLEATEAKYSTVFAGMTDDADAFIEKFRELTPATTAEARNMASGIQDLLVPMGFMREDATRMTGEFMHVTGALQAFNSATHSAQDVASAMQSALSGQYMPLRSLGIQLDKTTIAQKAMEQGLIETESELTKQIQAQVMLSEVYAQSSDALEAYKEENLDTKTQLGLLRSEVVDAAADLGQTLLPIIKDQLIPMLQSLVDRLKGGIEAFQAMDPRMQNMILGAVGLLAALGPVLLVLGKLVALFGAMLNPIGLVVAALAGLAAGVVYLWQTNERFREIVMAVWGAVQDFMLAVLAGIQAFWEEWGADILAFATDTFNAIYDTIRKVMELVKSIIDLALGWILAVWKEHGDSIVVAWEFMWGLVSGLTEASWNLIKDIFSGAFDMIGGVLDTFIGLFTGDWERMWEGIKSVARGAANVLIGIVNGVIGAFESMVNAIAEAVNKIPKFSIPSWVPGIGGNSFGLPNIPTASFSRIPTLHSGTDFFRPPGGAMEGLAMLQRGEQVIPRGGGRSVTVNISGNQISSDYDVDRIGDQLVKKLRLEGVV